MSIRIVVEGRSAQNSEYGKRMKKLEESINSPFTEREQLIFDYIKMLGNEWGYIEWDDYCGDPYIYSDKIIKELKELLQEYEVEKTHCKCGEKLRGHEDEGVGTCKWCATGWVACDDNECVSEAVRI